MSRPSHNYKHPNRAMNLAANTVLAAERVRPYRQQTRRAGWLYEWAQMSGQLAPRDSHGLIPRRVRRAMARAKWKRIWRASRG